LQNFFHFIKSASGRCFRLAPPMNFWWLLATVSLFGLLWGLLRKARRKNLHGLVVLVSGGGSGIGRRMSLKFAARGCKVVLWDINTAGGETVVSEIKAKGGKAWFYYCNVGEQTNVEEVAAQVKKEVGHVDVIVNNAGIVSGKFITDLSTEHINRTFAVNVLAHFWILKEFLPDMIDKKEGHIVTIASAAAISASTKMCDYVASKFAVFGLNESLRVDLRRRGLSSIHTTVVCPYYINTGMFEGVKTRFSWLLPILDEQYVADRVVDAVEHNDAYVVLPWLVNLTFVARLLPVSIFDWLNDFLGVSHTMDDFKGCSSQPHLKGN
jgi:all-trans-retinol dehydrogenase (NAD+)